MKPMPRRSWTIYDIAPVLIVGTLCLQGCMKQVYIHPVDETFLSRTAVIPLSASFLLDESVKEFTMDARVGKYDRRFYLGYALEVHGRKALEKIFKKVYFVPDGKRPPFFIPESQDPPRQADRVVKFRFGPESSVDLGKGLISKKSMKMTLELICEIYDAEGKDLLWEGSGRGSSEKSYKTLYASLDHATRLVLLRRPIFETLLQMLANESMMNALEQINDQLAKSPARVAILRK